MFFVFFVAIQFGELRMKEMRPSAEFLEAFRQAAGAAGTLPFDRFMELALYHPKLGYYRREQTRVGRSRGSDFVTSSSVGSLFGELVAAAAAKLVRNQGGDPAQMDFIELGAEPGGGVLNGVAHPFRQSKILRLGDPLSLSGHCVVFSNELFDAQPCRSFVRREDGWRERGVKLTDAGTGLELVDLALSTETFLPSEAPEGYVFDAPRAAATLLSCLVAQPWTGLFLAFDYGKSYETLAYETPSGTLRAYYRHQQEKNLLARPGEQDLTFHVCWDWLAAELEDAGFEATTLETQESFFVKQAGEHIAREVAAEATRVSPRKLALLQLIHPGNLGSKFQALHAWRTEIT